ncbi:Uncharacterised protein [Vibrio cholerae]|nr:Uncharacterised protein [Vibrio cholerae]CSI09913.1 Uncharacterised protein [Vibrio cholerae]CSI62506.1 Uncharacterised protein [Vibrio cholerae]
MVDLAYSLTTSIAGAQVRAPIIAPNNRARFIFRM